MRIWNGLKKPFWGRANQSSDDIISAHVCRVCDPCVLALKTGMDISGQVWRSVGKDTSSGPFWLHTWKKIYQKSLPGIVGFQILQRTREVSKSNCKP